MDRVNVTISINGEVVDVPAGTDAYSVIRGFYPDMTRIAVEIDGEICPKSQLSNFHIKGGERIEVVSFVGGG